MTEKADKKEPTFETVHDVLHHIQQNIVAPKTQYNKFGDYYYRDAEDILEAAKKVMPESGSITITDDVLFVPAEYEIATVEKTEKSEKQTVQKSGGRVYIKSVATLTWGGQSIQTSAMAREEMTKKGMDASQVTAATSSYARKIALNGLLMIDDTKDEDKHSKVTKKEREEAALMEKTGTDNPEDAAAANALGGSVRDGVDAETRDQMYNQALKEISGCADEETLRKVFEKIKKGISVFSDEQRDDIIRAKDQQKNEIKNKPPF